MEKEEGEKRRKGVKGRRLDKEGRNRRRKRGKVGGKVMEDRLVK